MFVIIRGGRAVDLSRFGLDHATREETYQYVRDLGVDVPANAGKQAMLEALAEHYLQQERA